MKILAIETSCDETSLALLDAKGGLKNLTFSVEKHLISSQIKLHRPFGGVVPNLAKREHTKNLPLLCGKIFGISNFKFPISNKKTASKFSQIDAIAVTVGPGLEPALWAGITFAKELQRKMNSGPLTSLRANKRQVALFGVNHMEAHLYSFLLQQKTVSSNDKVQISNLKGIFPMIALVVSGGHTILLKMDSLIKWKKLGETRDDAAGEAFDKVARMLKLPYPGGPEIAKLALKGNENAINFPRPMLKIPSEAKGSQNNYEFSFSGLKTSVLYYLRDNPRAKKADVAASFQKAVVDVLSIKTMRSVKEYRAKSVVLCGGVAANKALRANLEQITNNLSVNFFVPPFEYNTDNAAMIGVAAYINYLRKRNYPLQADANLNL